VLSEVQADLAHQGYGWRRGYLGCPLNRLARRTGWTFCPPRRV